MSLAEDLLNSLPEDQPAVTSSGPATEPHIVINSDKTITIPEALKRILVQHEHNIETVTFDCPRYWDGHDLSQMGLRIVFQRSDGHKEPHPVENLRIDDSNNQMIHFDWTISGNTTFTSGNVKITVCAKLTNAEGVGEREWHTIPNHDLFVNEGMDCSGEEIVERNPDVIEYILAELDDLKNATPATPPTPRLSLGYHTDGLVYLFVDGNPTGNGIALPTGGINGYVDSENNIVINNLPSGSYSVHYEMDDGSILEIGDLVVDEPEPDEPVAPAYINQIPISTDATGDLFVGPNGEKGYKPGYRLSMTSGTEKVAEGYSVTGFIPVKLGDVIRIKSIPVAGDNANIATYNSNKQPVNNGTSTYGTLLSRLFVEFGTEENGVYTATLSDAIHGCFGVEDLAFIRIGSTSITDDSIVTINQEIV